MLPLNKSKPRYYLTREQLYLITEHQLQHLGLVSELFSSSELVEPSFIYLGSDCYEIFINSAEQIYSPKDFLKQNQKNFILHFPHLDIENYKLFFDQPKFDQPYLGIAIEKYWLESLTHYLNNRKFFSTDIQPLATLLFEKNLNQEQIFSCLELSTETTFIKVNNMLDMILRKPISEVPELELKIWMGMK